MVIIKILLAVSVIEYFRCPLRPFSAFDNDLLEASKRFCDLTADVFGFIPEFIQVIECLQGCHCRYIQFG